MGSLCRRRHKSLFEAAGPRRPKNKKSCVFLLPRNLKIFVHCGKIVGFSRIQEISKAGFAKAHEQAKMLNAIAKRIKKDKLNH